MTDLVTFGEIMLRLSPPGQERLELATELEFRAAGAEANVAVNAHRLGAPTTYLTKLPDNPLGRKVRATLARHGVDLSLVWSDEGRQGTYYIEQAGAPRGANVVYDRQDAAVTTATPDELDTDVVADADVFFTCGITPGLSETLSETTPALLERARERDTTTAFDVNYRSKVWSRDAAGATIREFLPLIDVLFTAERDARDVLGYEGDAVTIAESLYADEEFETVVVTRGEEGAVAVHEGEVIEQGTFPADTHDPIGTGDAFVGGFLARRLQDDGVGDAMEYGAATAALKRTIPGDVAVVTPQEVERVIEAETAAISR